MKAGCFPGPRPVGFDRTDLAQRDAHRLSALRGETHEACPSVAGIWPAFDVATVLQPLDQLAHRLVGHVGAGGQLCEACAFAVEVLEHGVRRGWEVWVAGGGEPLGELDHHQVRGAAEQADERGLRGAVGDRLWLGHLTKAQGSCILVQAPCILHDASGVVSVVESEYPPGPDRRWVLCQLTR